MRRFVVFSIIAAVLLISGCTTNDSASNLSLASSSRLQQTAIEGAKGSPLSLAFDNTDKVPVPVLKESAFAGNQALENPQKYAGGVSDAMVSEGNKSVGQPSSSKSSAVVLAHATPMIEDLIRKYSTAYNVPEALVRRVVKRESDGDPQAKNGPYWGLMQISHPTAKGMGYDGKPEGLLDAETNLRYAVKYLAGAYQVADGNDTQAVRLYARGYYYDAKAKGLLEQTGLKPGPNSPQTAYEAVNAVASKTADDQTPVMLGGVPVPAAKPMD